MYEALVGMSTLLLIILAILGHHYYDFYENPLDKGDDDPQGTPSSVRSDGTPSSVRSDG